MDFPKTKEELLSWLFQFVDEKKKMEILKLMEYCKLNNVIFNYLPFNWSPHKKVISNYSKSVCIIIFIIFFLFFLFFFIFSFPTFTRYLFHLIIDNLAGEFTKKNSLTSRYYYLFLLFRNLFIITNFSRKFSKIKILKLIQFIGDDKGVTIKYT